MKINLPINSLIMENEKLETIKNEIQFIIDCIAKKEFA